MRLALHDYSIQQSSAFESVPYQNLTERTRHLLINPLLCAGQLNVHVAVDAHETTLVLGLAPFETDNNFLVDPVMLPSQQDLMLRTMNAVKS
jgi:hypothetical protein